MIVTPVESKESWSCLARRGMLHSETEAFEFWRLARGDAMVYGEITDEAVIILAGKALVGGDSISAGEVLLAPVGTCTTLRAVTSLEVVVVSTYPPEVVACLPPRVPELPERERAI